MRWWWVIYLQAAFTREDRNLANFLVIGDVKL